MKRNDRNAYSELFDGYFDKLFTFALNMVFREDVANDIVQEVFIAIYEKSVFSNYKGSLKAYLYTSVRNRCYNYLRDAKVEDQHMALYAEAAVYSDNLSLIHILICTSPLSSIQGTLNMITLSGSTIFSRILLALYFGFA